MIISRTKSSAFMEEVNVKEKIKMLNSLPKQHVFMWKVPYF